MMRREDHGLGTMHTACPPFRSVASWLSPTSPPSHDSSRREPHAVRHRVFSAVVASSRVGGTADVGRGRQRIAVHRCAVAALWLMLVCIPVAGDETRSSRVSQSAAAADTARRHKALASLSITDISGKMHSPFSQPDTIAIALFFVSTDCPVANTFQPHLRELDRINGARGIRSFMVYCTPGLTREQISRHVKDYEISMPAVHDDTQRLGRLTRARVTPEVILIDRTGAIRYRGMINNLYAGYGRKRAQPSRHYFRDACSALLAGEKIATPATQPIGCFIRYSDSGSDAR